MRVILVHSLTDFLTEAPPPRLCRLSLVEARLNLQAQTRGGLVWLSDQYDSSAPPEVHAQLPAALDTVAAWLSWQGYEVRPGRWATPAGVKPDRGRFECFKWENCGKGWQLSPG